MFGPKGDLFVASYPDDNVLEFNGTTGALQKVFGRGGGLKGPRGLRFGPNGDLFVISLVTRQVLEYKGTTGAFKKVFTSGGELREPALLIFSRSKSAVLKPPSRWAIGLGLLDWVFPDNKR